MGLAGVDGQSAEPLLLQNIAGALLQGLEVLGKKLAVALMASCSEMNVIAA